MNRQHYIGDPVNAQLNGYQARVDAEAERDDRIERSARKMVAEMQDDDDLLNEAIGAALEKEPRPGIDNLAPLLREAAKTNQTLADWLDRITSEYAQSRAETEECRNAA